MKHASHFSSSETSSREAKPVHEIITTSLFPPNTPETIPGTQLPKWLNDTLIPTLPPAAYYVSEFVTPTEEANLLQKINSVPVPTWRVLSHRRLQAHPSPLSSSNTLLEAPLPLWLVEPIIPRLMSLGLLADRQQEQTSPADAEEPSPTIISTVPGTSDAEFTKALPAGVKWSTLDLKWEKGSYLQSEGDPHPFHPPRQWYRIPMTLAQASHAAKRGHPINSVSWKSRILNSDPDDESVYCQHKEDVLKGSPHGRPNHVLINEYLPGQGIMPHEDGDAYWPVVCTVSLGSGIVYDAYPKEKAEGETTKKWRMFQEPRSLLITTGEMYRGCLHGIASVEIDEDVNGSESGVINWDLLRKETKEQIAKDNGRNIRGTRISLTFRDVIKVKKLGKGLGFLGK